MSDWPTCSTCAFWDEREDNPEYGYCRRHPPRIFEVPGADITRVGSTLSLWPVVNEEDFCGEHPLFRRWIATKMEGPS